MGGGQVWGFLGGHGSWDTVWGAPGSHLQPTRMMLQPGRVHCTQVPVYREHRNPPAARATCSLRPQGALGAQTRVLQEPHPPGPPPSFSASTLRRAFSCKRGLGRSAAVVLRGSGRNWVRPGVRLSLTTCTFSMTGLTGIQSESRILQDPQGTKQSHQHKGHPWQLDVLRSAASRAGPFPFPLQPPVDKGSCGEAGAETAQARAPLIPFLRLCSACQALLSAGRGEPALRGHG